MSPDTIFAQAIDIPSAPERAAFLEQAWRDDPGLWRDVEQLVRYHFRAGAFLERPAVRSVGTVEEAPVTERPGSLIGPYKLLGPLGEGGMSTVFLAQRTETVICAPVGNHGVVSRPALRCAARWQQPVRGLRLNGDGMNPEKKRLSRCQVSEQAAD